MRVHFYIESKDLCSLTSIVKNFTISSKVDKLDSIPFSKSPKAFKNFECALEVSLEADEYIRLEESGFIEEIKLLIN